MLAFSWRVNYREVLATSVTSKLVFIHLFLNRNYFKKICIYLAVLGLCCCVGFCLVAASGDFSRVAVFRLLSVVAPLPAEHGLWGARVSVVAARGFDSCGSWARERRLSSCGAKAQLLCSTWELPGARTVNPHLPP